MIYHIWYTFVNANGFPKRSCLSQLWIMTFQTQILSYKGMTKVLDLWELFDKGSLLCLFDKKSPMYDYQNSSRYRSMVFEKGTQIMTWYHNTIKIENLYEQEIVMYKKFKEVEYQNT